MIDRRLHIRPAVRRRIRTVLCAIPTALAEAVVVTLCFVPSAPPVFAQEGLIEEVIVTARKREEGLQDTPISITAFTAGDLETLRAKSRASPPISRQRRVPRYSSYKDPRDDGFRE